MVQIGVLKFCRIILVSSRGLKKRVTIIVEFYFMKRRLKTNFHEGCVINWVSWNLETFRNVQITHFILILLFTIPQYKTFSFESLNE